MTTIVLRDADSNDVTFTLFSASGDSLRFGHTPNDVLLGQEEVQLRIQRKQGVNRVYAKIILPHVCDAAPGCTPVVDFTEIGSLDLSSVLMADSATRKRFFALFASLASSPDVQAMVEDGILPA